MVFQQLTLFFFEKMQYSRYFKRDDSGPYKYYPYDQQVQSQPQLVIFGQVLSK